MNKYNQRGTIAEFAFITEAIKRDYQVSLPISHDSRYDVLLDNGKKIFRCQIKRVFTSRGVWYNRPDKEKKNPNYYEILSVEMRRRTPNGKTKGSRYSENDFDYLVAYRVETNDVWFVPIKDAMTSHIYFTDKSNSAKYKNLWI